MKLHRCDIFGWQMGANQSPVRVEVASAVDRDWLTLTLFFPPLMVSCSRESVGKRALQAQNPTSNVNDSTRMLGVVIPYADLDGRHGPSYMPTMFDPIAFQAQPPDDKGGSSELAMGYSRPTSMKWEYARGLDTYLAGNVVRGGAPDYSLNLDRPRLGVYVQHNVRCGPCFIPV